MATNNFPHVYQPLDVGSMHLKNRIQFSPIVSNHAGFRDGSMTDKQWHFLRGQAKTGAALVTIGSTPVDFEEGRDFFGCLAVDNDDVISGLAWAAREMHKFDCNVSIELTHAGQWAQGLLSDGRKAFVPSLLDGVHDPELCQEITREQMDKVLQHHVDAIKRCKAAGFDQVMVHVAHGNLLSSFLSPHWNHRTDEYGGSFENRVRFPLEVLEAAREATGGDIPIEIRFVGNEYIDNGMGLEERIKFLELAKPYIDMVLVSGGTLQNGAAFGYNMPGYYAPEQLNVKYAAAYKESHPDLVISVCGGIGTLEQAEAIIAEGKADIVAMAKGLMADSEYVNKGLHGREDDIRPCLRCNYCIRNLYPTAHLEGCAVNPIMGWEYRGTKLIPTPVERKAMVIGGGPGGMEAARVLRARGFDVVLYEKEDKLGGRLPEASALPQKTGFRRYFDWTVRKTEESGARIVLGCEVTPDIIRKEDPDFVIIATGAEMIKPSIPGIDGEHVHDVVDVDRDKAGELGHRIVVCGSGLSGSECGIGLAMEGHDVTLVDMIPADEWYVHMSPFTVGIFEETLEKNQIKRLGSAKVKEFKPEGVLVEIDGEEQLLECDDAVYAFGLRPNSAAIEELASVVPDTYIIGDAHRVGLLGDAVNEAYWVSRELGDEIDMSV